MKSGVKSQGAVATNFQNLELPLLFLVATLKHRIQHGIVDVHWAIINHQGQRQITKSKSLSASSMSQ